jgi:hypothetical protein
MDPALHPPDPRPAPSSGAPSPPAAVPAPEAKGPLAPLVAGTRFVVGALDALTGAARAESAPSPADTVVDAALAAALDVQRRTVEVAGRAVTAATEVVDRVAAPALGTLARAVEPLAEQGRAERAAARTRARVTLDGAARVVVDAVLDLVDIDTILRTVDVDQIIRRVDIDAIIERVDVDRIVSRVDIDAIVGRVDVQAIVERVDIDAIVGRVDIERIVADTEIGSLIVRSTGGVATETIDLVRSQGVGLDGFVARIANRVLRRRPDTVPAGPPLLIAPPDGAPR